MRAGLVTYGSSPLPRALGGMYWAKSLEDTRMPVM